MRGVLVVLMLVALGALVIGLGRCDPGGPAAGSRSEATDAPRPQPAQVASDPSPSAAAETGDGLPENLPPPLPTEPEPLGPTLTPIFQLIQQRQTMPARVRLLPYRKGNPNDGKAAFLFGLSFHREKRYAQALAYYDEAIELEPGYPLTWYFRGWALYYLGRPEAARVSFERHLGYQPRTADSYFALGLIDLDANRLEPAEQRFRHALELDAGGPRRTQEIAKAHAQLGEVHIRRGEHEQARLELEQAVELHPDAYEAWYRLYRVLLRLGDEEAAAQALAAHDAARDRLRPGTAFPDQ